MAEHGSTIVIGTIPEGREPSPVDRAVLGAKDLNVHRALAKSLLPGARVGRCWQVRHEDIAAFPAGELGKPAERAALAAPAGEG
jgi:hypothetical protein